MLTGKVPSPDPLPAHGALNPLKGGVGSAHVTMKRTVPVAVVSGDRSRRPEARKGGGLSALAGALARTRYVERLDAAASKAHEAVVHIARVKVRSCDRPLLIDVES